jgi:protein-disulfide isomerase
MHHLSLIALLSATILSTAHAENTPATPTNTLPSSFTSTQQEELKKFISESVKENITKNPEVIINTLQRYGEEQQKNALKQENQKASQYIKELTNDKTAIISGNPTGKIKLVIFSDPNCGHCRHFEEALNSLKGEFNNVKIYMRPWAIRGQDSVDVIKLLTALNKESPTTYEAVSKALYKSQEGINKQTFLKLVKDANFEPKKLEETATLDAATKIVNANKELAEKKLGLNGTPSIFLIDAKGLEILLPGDKDSLKKSLSEAKV